MKNEKYGFVYLWFDRKHKRFYVGCHWGTTDDGYICSSNWMRDAYKRRPEDFKRRILKSGIKHRPEMYVEEQRYFDMIKPSELKVRYYNLTLSSKEPWHKYDEHIKTVGQKISASKKGKKTVPCSPEKAAKISEANKGRKFSEEHRAKLRAAKLGTKHTEEWKQANSERMKAQWNNPESKRNKSVSIATKKRWEEYRAT